MFVGLALVSKLVSHSVVPTCPWYLGPFSIPYSRHRLSVNKDLALYHSKAQERTSSTKLHEGLLDSSHVS